MAAPQHFRSALNGFNREDVVNYISYITNTHETQLGQLRTELAEVKEERDELLKTDDSRDLLDKVEDLESRIQDLCEEILALKQERDEKDERIRELEQRLEAQAAVLAQPEPTRWSEELNAYRRAESVERRARERVNQMVDRANGALADASVRLEESTAEIARITQKVRADLDLLQAAVGESQTALANTAVIIGAVRVDED